MKPIIKTDRLIIRELQSSDAQGIFLMDSNPAVHEFLGKSPITTLEEAQNAILFIRKQYETNGIGRWAMLLKDTNEFIGWTGLKLINTETVNGHQNFYELGYRLNQDHWRKGYGFEAAKACLDYAFSEMQLDKVYAYAESGNIGSQTILQKLQPVHTESFPYDGVDHIWFEFQNNKIGS
ncbi:GNAT family N-acetyltransferase [Flavobacterium cerinum]|uniref:GNAT family N-acetyltransferase n=1 Tax=Flavobacterium cerinum TaxID=2502784 RepID=A0ABY5IRT3_9FLAO|nr:GNAT family N-acetyltransferase [Flavobacterium cerinum]UUC44975.1 GNAT family N-acetyltransferase [Flavobacterium cerinum]